MTINYTDNKNPIVGPRDGSKQEISLFDKNLGNRRIIATTPEKIDEFVAKRKEAVDEAKKKYGAIALFASALSAIPAVVMNIGKNIAASRRRLGLTISAACFVAGTMGSLTAAQQKINAANDKLSQEFIEENK